MELPKCFPKYKTITIDRNFFFTFNKPFKVVPIDFDKRWRKGQVTILQN